MYSNNMKDNKKEGEVQRGFNENASRSVFDLARALRLEGGTSILFQNYLSLIMSLYPHVSVSVNTHSLLNHRMLLLLQCTCLCL